MTEPDGDRWVFLIDPAWQPAPTGAGGDETPAPPRQAVVGGWRHGADGSVGRFLANPDYEPSSPLSPTDPVDAALRLAATGEASAEQLFAVLKAGRFGVALDEAGDPIVAPAPDEAPSLLVTTAPAHRGRVAAASWREATAADLVGLLDAAGADLLLNPGARASTRLIASAVAAGVASGVAEGG